MPEFDWRVTCSGSTGFPFILLAADKTALASSIRPLIERKIQLSRPVFLLSYSSYFHLFLLSLSSHFHFHLTFTFILHLSFAFIFYHLISGIWEFFLAILLSSCPFHLTRIIPPCNQPSRRLWQPVKKNYTNSHHCRDDLRKVK